MCNQLRGSNVYDIVDASTMNQSGTSDATANPIFNFECGLIIMQNDCEQYTTDAINVNDFTKDWSETIRLNDTCYS